jgi:uncharacterized protein DUF5005
MLAIALIVCAIGAMIGPAPAAHGAAACVPRVRVSATGDPVFSQRFSSYGNDNTSTDDWTGGDGTYSVQLPDGRVLWMFSDTYLGRVRFDGTRPTSAPIIHNDFVVQKKGSLTETVHGGSSQAPTSLIEPDDADWAWVGDATVEGDHLRQFVSTYVRTGTGMWDWRWSGTDIVSFSLPDLRIVGTTAAPTGVGVDHGAGLLEDGPYTYLYGVEDQQSVKYLHVARAAAGNVLGPWEFWDGTGWSSDPNDSARVMSGVANSVSVVRRDEAYVLVTQDTSVPFSNQIVAYVACSPQGPFTNRTRLYTTPETGGDLFTYNALAHPEFTNRQGFLVSYNVNSFDLGDLYQDVTIYRPRFIRVKVVRSS